MPAPAPLASLNPLHDNRKMRSIFSGRLKMQDRKTKDQNARTGKRGTGKCRIWKWKTVLQAVENEGLTFGAAFSASPSFTRWFDSRGSRYNL